MARPLVPRVVVCLGCMVGIATGCGLPQDPENTLERVRGGTLRAGLVLDPPWSALEEGQPVGIDVELLSVFARSLGAEVTWSIGSEAELLPALKAYRLDVVGGGLTKANPRLKKVGVSLPYFTSKDQPPWAYETLGERVLGKKHVMAVPPGENGFLVALDQVLSQEAARVTTRRDAGARR